jgi:hypothetical protein
LARTAVDLWEGLRIHSAQWEMTAPWGPDAGRFGEVRRRVVEVWCLASHGSGRACPVVSREDWTVRAWDQSHTPVIREWAMH